MLNKVLIIFLSFAFINLSPVLCQTKEPLVNKEFYITTRTGSGIKCEVYLVDNKGNRKRLGVTDNSGYIKLNILCSIGERILFCPKSRKYYNEYVECSEKKDYRITVGEVKYSRSIEGSIQGFTCVVKGKICPVSQEDPMIASENIFVVLTASKKFYFVPNIDRGIMARHINEKIKIEGLINDTYNAITAEAIYTWVNGKWSKVWDENMQELMWASILEKEHGVDIHIEKIPTAISEEVSDKIIVAFASEPKVLDVTRAAAGGDWYYISQIDEE